MGALERSRRDRRDAEAELETTSAEANEKIDAANDRIRTLRKDRDEAVQERERFRDDNGRLMQENEAMDVEKQGLEEQKEALLKIVEDLHSSCVGAGVPMAGRVSLEQRLTQSRLSGGFSIA